MKQFLGFLFLLLWSMIGFSQVQLFNEAIDQRGNTVSVNTSDISYITTNTTTLLAELHTENRKVTYATTDTLADIVANSGGLFLALTLESDSSVVAINTNKITRFAAESDNSAVVVIENRIVFDVTETYASIRSRLQTPSIGIPILAEVADANPTATLSKILPINTTSAADTVQTPANPLKGDWFMISDSRSNANANNITVQSADKIYGATADYTINVDGVTLKFVYVNATVGWIVQ